MPRSVNAAAFEVLDALFPAGQRSRRAVSMAFRLWFHPLEGPRSAFQAALACARLASKPFILAKNAFLSGVTRIINGLRHLLSANWTRAKWQ